MLFYIFVRVVELFSFVVFTNFNFDLGSNESSVGLIGSSKQGLHPLKKVNGLCGLKLNVVRPSCFLKFARADSLNIKSYRSANP